MKMPPRQYIVIVRRGPKVLYGYGTTRQEAISAADVKPGEPFAYKLYEGQNQVECVAKRVGHLGRMLWRERGK